jgi:short-subunit dehydrogenase
VFSGVATLLWSLSSATSPAILPKRIVASAARGKTVPYNCGTREAWTENSMEEGVAVVTGASSGIGEVIAKHLRARGRTVIALQRRPPRLAHARLHHQPADLADAQAAQSAAAEIAGTHPVRYLVNNAGANRPGLLEQATLEDLDYGYALNVRAAVILIKAFAPGMREA